MDSFELTDQSVIAVLPAPTQRTQPQKALPRTQRAPNYHVVIWNDEDHSFEYVIEMLMRIFNHNAAKAYDLTWKVHHEGKCIACTTHRELAELRREQIATYGPDVMVAHAQPVSMRATIEEVPQ